MNESGITPGKKYRKLTQAQINKFKHNTLRLEISTRGGGIEIDLTPYGFKGEKMTAYQNYLGGGMLGCVTNDCTYSNWMNNDKLIKIATRLRQYFHLLTNPDEGEWESVSFEQNQSMPVSAY